MSQKGSLYRAVKSWCGHRSHTFEILEDRRVLSRLLILYSLFMSRSRPRTIRLKHGLDHLETIWILALS